MKGLLFCGIFAAFYMLVILLFPVNSQAAGQPGPGISDQPKQPNNSTNPVLNWIQGFSTDAFGLSDTAFRNTMQNMYGTMQGNPECVKRSVCIMGNYLRNLPGRDIIFFLMSQYVPPEYTLFYDIFRISAMYGQNCQLFACDNKSPPAAGAGAADYAQHTTPVPIIIPAITAPTATTASPKEILVDNEVHKGPKMQNRPNF